MPTYLNLIFHGPWGFAVDTSNNANSLFALTPVCKGHQYWMTDGINLLPMPRGNYAFTDESVFSGASNVPPDPNASSAQTFLGTPPPRFVVPDPGQDARVHCRFTLPAAELLGCLPVPRKPYSPDCDNLLSGRHFHLLNPAPASKQPCYLARVQVARYAMAAPAALQLLGDGGGQPLNVGPSTSDIKLHLIAVASAPAAEDHFAMMAALFNLDLHLDGPDLMQPVDPQYVPPAGLTLPDLLYDPPWLQRTRAVPMVARPPMNALFPTDQAACGYSVVIGYNPGNLIVPPGSGN